MTAALDKITRISTTSSASCTASAVSHPPEAEAQYYSQHVTDRPAGSQNPEDA